jgi:hypothetical protein
MLALVLGAATRASGADPRDQGRRHAKKANQLAAAGRCRPAVPEFTRAYELLHDPALLFNRAECERKLGLSRRAVADYRQFLAEMPNAPNRKLIEARLAALDPGWTPAPDAGAGAAAGGGQQAGAVAGTQPGAAVGGGQPPAGEPVPAAGSSERAPVAAGAPAPAGIAPSTAAEAAPGAVATGPGSDPDPFQKPPAPAPVPLPVDRPAPVGLGERPPPEPDRPPRTGVSAWVWIGLGALAVAAGVAGGIYAYNRSHTDVPASTLGNVKF